MQEYSIPDDFNYENYLNLNPDLLKYGINTKTLAILHYLTYGIKEKRLYKKPQLIKNIDAEFDYVFYLSEYPDTASYCKHIPHITQQEKLFHHYSNYGKHEGRFKNKIEQDLSVVRIDFDISQYINYQDLVYPNNNLECICLLTTTKEINNNDYDRFIEHLIKNTKSSIITKNIDFKIIVNKSIQKINTTYLSKIFRSVKIINLELDDNEDIYLKSLPEGHQLPKYGLKSGPNISFFQTIKLCTKYNSTLMLETDCMLGKDWLSRLYNYTKYSNGFLVSGATYDGSVFAKAGSTMLSHINGGTALYATGHNVLQQLIIVLSIFLQNQIKKNMIGLAYDYALKILIDNNLNNINISSEDRAIWKFINRNYLPCKHIINCSTPNDKTLDPNILNQQYNYAILHKKYE